MAYKKLIFLGMCLASLATPACKGMQADVASLQRELTEAKRQLGITKRAGTQKELKDRIQQLESMIQRAGGVRQPTSGQLTQDEQASVNWVMQGEQGAWSQATAAYYLSNQQWFDGVLNKFGWTNNQIVSLKNKLQGIAAGEAGAPPQVPTRPIIATKWPGASAFGAASGEYGQAMDSIQQLKIAIGDNINQKQAFLRDVSVAMQ